MPDKPRSKRQSSKQAQRSAFSIILDQKMVVQSGKRRLELGPHEALQFKIYEEGLQGKIGAARKVLSWIREREDMRKPHERVGQKIRFEFENQNPVSMDQALLILGIASENEEQRQRGEKCLRLQSWAVKLALDQDPQWPDSAQDLAELRAHTADPENVDWPIVD